MWDETAAMDMAAEFVAEHLGVADGPLAAVMLDEPAGARRPSAEAGATQHPEPGLVLIAVRAPALARLRS